MGVEQTPRVHLMWRQAQHTQRYILGHCNLALPCHALPRGSAAHVAARTCALSAASTSALCLRKAAWDLVGFGNDGCTTDRKKHRVGRQVRGQCVSSGQHKEWLCKRAGH